MAIQKEFWVNDISENLFPDNSFAKNARQTIAEYIRGKYVHIPQAGAVPNVVVDRTTIPATSTRRVDTDIVFRIQSFSTDPVTIREEELQFETKDKIRSVLADHVGALSELVHTNLIYAWVAALAANASAGNAGSATAAASVVRTSGANVTAHLSGATGTRKALTFADMQSAKLVLDKQRIDAKGRYALLTPDMEKQLINDASLQGFRMQAGINNSTGTLEGQMIAGFMIMVRVNTAVYDNVTPTIKAVGAASAVTDNDMVLCWQKDCVETAQGDIKFYELIDSPLSYGSIYSTEMFAGGTKRRKDGTGIVAIVQIP